MKIQIIKMKQLTDQISQYLKLRIANEARVAKLFIEKKTGLLEVYAYRYLVENLEPLLFNIFEDVKHQYKRTHEMSGFEQELFASMEEDLREIITKHTK